MLSLNTNAPVHIEFCDEKVSFSMFDVCWKGGFNTPYRPHPFTEESTSYNLDLGKDEEEQMAVNVRVRGEFASPEKNPGLPRRPFLKLRARTLTIH